MSVGLDETHDPALTSWVGSANTSGTDFPLQNMPYGEFGLRGSSAPPRIGVAIGDRVLDISACTSAGLLASAQEAARTCAEPALNALMALGRAPQARLRLALSRLLRAGSPDAQRVPSSALIPLSDVELHLPAVIGDYSDFFASIHHATNAGRLFRPDNPLLPNYKYVPIAYHGRASSIVVSGTAIRRPRGQTRAPGAAAPTFGACRRLDYELELGFFVGQGNALGAPITLAQAEDHVFGMCIVNDWSARDLQSWEYQPLGPFLGKSFGTTVSPWVVTLDALAPFRCAAQVRDAGDPEPLPYLSSEADRANGGIDVDVEVTLASQRMRESASPARTLARTSSRHLYWTVFQMVAHHASNGCNLRPGDLMATGTVSGPSRTELGSLLELTQGGAKAFPVGATETRTFLEDGDEIVMTAHCRREGMRTIGSGEARGVILPAHIEH